MRLKAKVDSNQNEIVQALRDYGCSVQSLAQIGKGCPDLLCAYRGKMFLMELKVDKGKLTLDQDTWHSRWKATVHIVRSADEAVGIIQDSEDLSQ